MTGQAKTHFPTEITKEEQMRNSILLLCSMKRVLGGRLGVVRARSMAAAASTCRGRRWMWSLQRDGGLGLATRPRVPEPLTGLADCPIENWLRHVKSFCRSGGPCQEPVDWTLCNQL
jgi:hypothetical protein